MHEYKTLHLEILVSPYGNKQNVNAKHYFCPINLFVWMCWSLQQHGERRTVIKKLLILSALTQMFIVFLSRVARFRIILDHHSREHSLGCNWEVLKKKENKLFFMFPASSRQALNIVSTLVLLPCLMAPPVERLMLRKSLRVNVKLGVMSNEILSSQTTAFI